MSQVTRKMSNNSRPLCRYFTSNICNKGENCEFSHDRNARPDMVCRYYLNGCCAYGSRCRYDHQRPKQNVPNITTNSSPVAPTAMPRVVQNAKSPPWAQNTTPKTPVVKPTEDDKVVLPAPPSSMLQWNPWQNTSPLNNFTQNIGLELELVGQECPPSSSSKSLATNIGAALADIPLCPYFEVGLCIEGEFCRFIHGLLCEMCGLNVLHPHNEAQRKIHHRECLAEHEKEMEAAFLEAKSAEMQCGICMEYIVQSNLRFGILQNCTHCYCLECIRKWRKGDNEEIDVKAVRACPECRVHSDYVIPSKIWIDDKAEKDKLVKIFHENTKKILCKYVTAGDVDKCPFGNKCFYKHQLPNSKIVVEGKSPNQLRNERRRSYRNHQHTFELLDYILFSSSDDESIDFRWL